MIGVYLRISTAQQSTDSQEQEVLKFASNLSEELVIFKDIISGKTKNRPALDELLENCRQGKISKVLCYKLDRLGRSLLNLKELLYQFESMNIPVVFTSQGISTEHNNPASKLFLTMLGAFAEFERDIICERVRAGIAVRMASGKPMGRTPTKQATKDRIHGLRQNGLSMAKIAKELEIGVATVHKVLNTTTKGAI